MLNDINVLIITILWIIALQIVTAFYLWVDGLEIEKVKTKSESSLS